MSRSLLVPRTTARPVEYPEVLPYIDAMRQSYWVHDEYSWGEDVQDYLTGLTPQERQVIKRDILAVAQVEVVVKSFWRDLNRSIPKPEFDSVGVTFGESETRHQDGYAHLLDLLNLTEEFNNISTYPALRDRLTYLDAFSTVSIDTHGVAPWLLKLILFSVFTEYSSLFSQFFIAKSFHKYTNRFKGLSNLVDATSKEEELHGKFGFFLVNQFRAEMPELFTEDLLERVMLHTLKAVRAEQKVLDWIFEGIGETGLGFVNKDMASRFFLHRVETALRELGWVKEWQELGVGGVTYKDDFEWFNVELVGTKHYDFFNQRPTNYSLMGKSYSIEDVFSD